MIPVPPLTPPAQAVVVVAGPGYGKTTWLRRACPPDGMVGSAVELVASAEPSPAWLGIDDLHLLPASDQLRLVQRHAPVAGLVITSREPLSEAVLAGLPAAVCLRSASDLTLAPYAVSRVLAERGIDDPALALAVTELTAGWPVLVHLAADELSRIVIARLPHSPPPTRRPPAGCTGRCCPS